MTPKEALKKAFEESGMRKAAVARALNTSPQNVNTKFHRNNNQRIDVLVKMLDLFGYDVAFVKKGSKLPSDAILITEIDKK